VLGPSYYSIYGSDIIVEYKKQKEKEAKEEQAKKRKKIE